MSLFLNMSGDEADRYIYRIVSRQRLVELFETGTNTLVHPSLWDDPYENFVLRSKVRRKSGEVVSYTYHENIYGQCWTRNKASDAMWRIYSHDTEGIRIRTTPRKLLHSLYHGGAVDPSRSCMIGKVRYLAENRMLSFAHSVYTDGTIEKENLFQSLLVKRLAFRHEKEVRLLYFDLHSSENGRVFGYESDPHVLVDQLMIDPRLSVSDAKTFKSAIRKETKFGGQILRSGLYSAPSEIVLGDGES